MTMKQDPKTGRTMTDEETITDEVYEQAKRIWGGPRAARETPWLDLPYTHCTSCPPDAMKRPCVCNVVDGTALCAEHWIEARIKERLAMTKAPVVIRLNLEDFARI